MLAEWENETRVAACVIATIFVAILIVMMKVIFHHAAGVRMDRPVGLGTRHVVVGCRIKRNTVFPTG